jgi:hypothetical protein
VLVLFIVVMVFVALAGFWRFERARALPSACVLVSLACEHLFDVWCCSSTVGLVTAEPHAVIRLRFAGAGSASRSPHRGE